jgi:hypothetical protein
MLMMTVPQIVVLSILKLCEIDRCAAEQCYTNVKLLFQEDILLICQDYKRMGGYAAKLFGTQ